MKTVHIAILFSFLLTFSAPAFQTEPALATKEYNLSKEAQLAIEGFDPVAYFPEGGGTPTKGSSSFSLTDRGVTYYFSSAEHLAAFKANPDKYRPAHGGWCSYAMGKSGEKVEVDPKSFIVVNDRLFLFYKDFFNDTRKSFLKEQASLTRAADESWKKFSGESPRTRESLLAQLEAMKAKYSKSAKAETTKLYEEGIQSVAASGVLESALKVGAVAPDFTLSDVKSQSIHLADLLKSGPVILTWYRGGWCPFCNLQLHAYQESLADFKAAGAQLVALSPELPDNSLSTSEKNSLQFAVVSDTANKVAHQYGIAYRLPENLINAFKSRLDLPKLNGDPSWELPLSATFIVNTDGKIAYTFINADYRNRAEPADILNVLNGLKAAK